MIKGSIYQKDIKIQIYVHSTSQNKYIKQILTELKGEIAAK